ncbi:MAG: ribonuclease HI family protein [bacterium]|nr:ribonuclease HI family protein [bacterium]
MKVIIYSDGGARGNPGPAAAGALVYSADRSEVLARISDHLGEATNNQAEYQAIYRALLKAKELGATEAECFLDSELVVKQLQLKYKVKNHNISDLFLKTWNLLQQFQRVTFHAIPREENKEADRLVNLALDGIGIRD